MIINITTNIINYENTLVANPEQHRNIIKILYKRYNSKHYNKHYKF